jgi:hypothetical protein
MSTLNSIDSSSCIYVGNNARSEIPILNNLFCKISTKIDVSSDSAFFIDLLNDKPHTVVVSAKYCPKNKMTFCILNKLIGVQSNQGVEYFVEVQLCPLGGSWQCSGDAWACWD